MTDLTEGAVSVLVDELHLRQKEIGRLTTDDAIERVHQYWSKPRD